MSLFAVAGCAALLTGVVAGCGGSDNGGGGGSAGSGGGGSAGSGGGGDGGGGGGGGTTGPGGPVGESYACPTDKPQKQYGWLPGAKNVLDSDETWTPDNVYLIYGPLDVPTTLTIMAGTVVCFDSGPPGADENPEGPPGSIRFRDQGAFKILGTASQHVVFAPHSDGHGLYWGAISIGPMVKTDVSTMQYLDVYNAGISSNGPALATFNSTFDAPTQPPLDMQNVVFRSVQRNGLTNYTQGFTAASKVTVQSYAADSIDGSKGADYLLDYPILQINPIAAKTLTATNFVVGPNVPKSVQYVQLDHPEGALLSANPITLHKLQTGLAWRNIANMKLLNTMTLDPGVVFQVNRNGGIEVGGHADGSGNIVAVGTAQDPVVFTSDAPSQSLTPAAAGDWGSLVFEGGNFDPNVSKFDYVTFEYGGGIGTDQAQNCSDGVNTVYAPILFMLPSDGQSYAGPAITHSTFVHSAGQAIRSTCSTSYCLTTDYTTAAAANTFTDIKVAPVEYWSGNETAMCM